jgi:hypothetical protein
MKQKEDKESKSLEEKKAMKKEVNDELEEPQPGPSGISSM